jgi:hypothetical protein
MCRQLANEELENWDEVYRNEDLSACRVGTLPNDGSYLCMPYLKPISIHQRLEQKEHVKKALERFAKSGYKHNDIRWRHFGWWNDVLYMCDLGDIEKMQCKKDGVEGEWIEEWVDTSMRKLEASMGATESRILSKRKRSPQG